jgi:hypothetical protein
MGVAMGVDSTVTLIVVVVMLVVSVLSFIEGTAPAGSGGQDGNGHFSKVL